MGILLLSLVTQTLDTATEEDFRHLEHHDTKILFCVFAYPVNLSQHCIHHNFVHTSKALKCSLLCQIH